jgi:8-oxo-dGTP pyrophosphatase MutT (NUDIX family)
VFGKYKPWDSEKLQYRFSNMTQAEKLLAWSCDFGKMWYHVWLKIPQADDQNDSFYQFYVNCRSKFDRLIAKDGGRRIRNMLNRSASIELGWEIPKGRKEENETEIDCATREMSEETGITVDDYTIFYSINPICASHEDESVIYVYKYYVAYTDKVFEPKINYNNSFQISEISDIKWMSLHDAILLTAQNKNLSGQVKLALKLFKRNHADSESADSVFADSIKK